MQNDTKYIPHVQYEETTGSLFTTLFRDLDHNGILKWVKSDTMVRYDQSQSELWLHPETNILGLRF